MENQPVNVGRVKVAPKQKSDQEITTFPFQINFTGKADLDSYLQPEENENGVVSATFRGRLLFGERVSPPEGFNMVTSTINRRPNDETTLNITGTVKHVLSYEYDRQPSKYTRLQRAMGYCKQNDWQSDEFLPELESEDVALKFIHSLQHSDIFADQKDLSSLKGTEVYNWVETMGQKGWRKDQEAKENHAEILDG